MARWFESQSVLGLTRSVVFHNSVVQDGPRTNVYLVWYLAKKIIPLARKPGAGSKVFSNGIENVKTYSRVIQGNPEVLGKMLSDGLDK